MSGIERIRSILLEARHIIVNRLLRLLKRRTRLIDRYIPAIRIDRRLFIDNYFANRDKAYLDCHMALAFRHMDYADALAATGAEITRIKHEMDLALHYGRELTVTGIREPILSFRWFTEGASTQLMTDQKQALAICADDAQLAAEYATANLETGHLDDALDFLNAYKRKNAIEYRSFLPLAHTVSKHYSWAEKYRPYADAFEILEAGREKFERLIKENDVCIVGNSPIEKGRGKGKKIDSHPLVIRFNNFSTHPEHQKDYGSKTDIWVKAGSLDVTPRKMDSLSFVVWEEDIWHTRQLPKITSRILDDSTSGIPTTYIPSTIHQELRRISGIHMPSTGLVTLFWIYRIRGRLEEGSIYGFSMTDQLQASRQQKHYFHNSHSSKRIAHHNWEIEAKVLSEMMAGVL